jgi:hypothetical protein
VVNLSLSLSLSRVPRLKSRLKVCLLRPTGSPTDSVRRATTAAATANKQQLLPLLHLLHQQRIFLLLSFRVLLFFPIFFLLGKALS